MKSFYCLLILLSAMLTVAAQQPVFRYNIQGCAAEHNPTKQKSVTTETEQIAWPDTLLVKGDSLVYQRTEDHMCCRKVKLSYEIKKDLITINEYWHGTGCKCKCSSSVEANLQKIPAGTYKVKVVATGTDPLFDKPSTGSETILEKVITVY